MKRRSIAIAVVIIALIAGGVRLTMTHTYPVGYCLLDDYNLAVQVIGAKAQWRGVTVDETDSTVSIDLKEISIRGPGFDDGITYVVVRLNDPLGNRTVIDASTAAAVQLLTP